MILNIENDLDLLSVASQFRVASGQHTVYITKSPLDNYNTSADGWVVVTYLSAMNPWYLNKDGTWKYKSYGAWEDFREAFKFLTFYPPKEGIEKAYNG